MGNIKKGHNVEVNIGKEGHEVAEPGVSTKTAAPVPTSPVKGPMGARSPAHANLAEAKHALGKVKAKYDTSKSLKSGAKHLGRSLAAVKR